MDNLTSKPAGRFKYFLVDEPASMDAALQKLRSHVKHGGYCPSLALDLEGVNLGRNGSVTVVTIATPDAQVFIFDILKLGGSAFCSGLKDILEDPKSEKLMFDCRHDADALWHLHGIKLDGVLDLQLMDVLLRRQLASKTFPTGARKAHMIRKGVERLNGYGSCAGYHVLELRHEMLAFKEAGKNLLLHHQDLWNHRPLTEEMIAYCCIDTAPMFQMFDALSGKMLSKYKGPDYVARARLASKHYADNLRRMPSFSGSAFEEHNYLPFDMDLFLEFEETAPEPTPLVCPHCLRAYHRRYRLSVHGACIVCLKVMQDQASAASAAAAVSRVHST